MKAFLNSCRQLPSRSMAAIRSWGNWILQDLRQDTEHIRRKRLHETSKINRERRDREQSKRKFD
jgi:hypothetical protein